MPNLFMINPIDKIIGQSKVKTLLKKIVDSNKIPHAFLFTGKEGIGKEFAAIQFAKYLFIKNSNGKIDDSIYRLIHNLQEPYIKYIFPLPRGKNENEDDSPFDKLKPDEIILIQNEFQKKAENPYYSIEIPNANNIKINSIRDISHYISLSLENNYKKIILISNAHLMKEEAQNALLKNLEEPPTNVIFILITPFPELLRETILSRCWRINFENLFPNEVEEILINYFKVENNLASKVSFISLGSIKTALSYLEYDLDFLTEKVIRILRYSFAKKFNSALEEMEEINKDKKLFKSIISLVILWLSYYNKYRFTNFEIPLTQFDETIKKFSIKYPDLKVTELIYTLENYYLNLDKNINSNIITSNLIANLSTILEH